MFPSSIKKYRQVCITALLLGMLIGGGHLPDHIESLVFYLVVFGVALIGYARSKPLNILLGCSTLFFLIAWFNTFQDEQLNVLFCISGLLCLVYGINSTIRFIIFSKEVSVGEVFALVNCYLIAGFFWALLYSMVEMLAPGSFVMQTMHDKIIDGFIYFSFTTMTTVGYGDTLPRSILAQRLSVVQAVSGQFYFALVVAYLINKLFQHHRETDE